MDRAKQQARLNPGVAALQLELQPHRGQRDEGSSSWSIESSAKA